VRLHPALTKGDLDASPRYARWLGLFAALGALGLHVSPLWREIKSWAAWGDCKYFWFVIEVDRVTYRQHGQFPLWNPFYAGGAPHLANPQSSSLSPLTGLILLFGTPLGYRLGYTLGLLAALLAMRAWARTLGLSSFASAVAGAGFAVCGAFAQHMGGGHWSWLGFALHPLLLRSLHLAFEGKREHIGWGALVFMILVFHSPIYPMAFAFVSVPSYALFLGLAAPDRVRGALRAVGTALAMLGLGVGLGAVRLFPMGEFVRAHPRLVKDWDFTWPQDLLTTYGMRYAHRGFGAHQYVFPEFGNYFGWIGLGLMLIGIGIVLARRRAQWPLVAGATLCVMFQLGNLIPMPWWMLKHLPVYQNLRVPSRFTILAGMFFCALIGVAVDAGTAGLARGSSGKRRALGVVVALAAIAYLFDAASWNRLQFLPTLGLPPPTDPPVAQFRQAPGDPAFMMLYPRQNLGSLNYFEETPLPRSPRLQPDLPADEYLADPGAGTVRRMSWTPNAILLDVNLKRPTTILVNQNWGPGWHAYGAELVENGEGGLLAARAPAGRHTIAFRYLPTSFVIGAGVSLLSLAFAVGLIVVARRRLEYMAE
jgi:hypothetical protein